MEDIKKKYNINGINKTPLKSGGYSYIIPTKELLYSLYIKENLSKENISKLFNISIHPVNKWLKIYNIHKSLNDVKECRRQTNIKKYGNECYTNREKAKNTCISKYGKEYYVETENFKEKSLLTTTRKYKRNNGNQIHIPSKSYNILTNKEFLIDYIKKESICSARHLSRKLNVSRYLTEKYINLFNLKDMMESFTSSGERELRDFISHYYHIEHNTRYIITPYELDIYIPDKNIAIEYNGDYWHSLERQKRVDKIKETLCNSKNIKLLIVTENDWINNKKNTKEKLLYEIKKYNNINNL